MPVWTAVMRHCSWHSPQDCRSPRGCVPSIVPATSGELAAPLRDTENSPYSCARGRSHPPVDAVLRLFRFRSAAPGFDAKIRDVLTPDVARLPGNLAAYAGRIGPDDDGMRTIATVWTSREAMIESVGEGFDAPVV